MPIGLATAPHTQNATSSGALHIPLLLNGFHHLRVIHKVGRLHQNGIPLLQIFQKLGRHFLTGGEI